MILHCHGCNTQYAIDEREEATVEPVACPDCGLENDIPVRPEDGDQEPAIPRQTDAPPPADRPVEDQVACPSCGHRFVPAAGPTEAKRGSVLLVEDQRYFAALTRDALGGDLDVTVATSISEARRILGARAFDVAILDLSLETAGDGRELLESLHLTGMPVLIFTAQDETDIYGAEWDDLRKAGATDILLKGMNVGEDLRRKVLGLIGTGPEAA